MALKIQSVDFKKDKSPPDINGGRGWTKLAARQWVEKHKFDAGDVLETTGEIRFRQFSPDACAAGSYETLTKDMPEGISLGSCEPAVARGSGGPNQIFAVGSVDFRCDPVDGQAMPDTDAPPRRPSFAIHSYTGAPMALDGFAHPVVVDLNGIRPPSPTLPVLRQHDPNRIVGQAQVTAINKAGVEPMGIHLQGTVTGDNHDAKEVVDHAKNGFKWQASIGAVSHRREFLEAGKKATVNGKEQTGPMHIIRQAELKEISFVPIGADGATSANVAAASSVSGPALKGAMSLFDTWIQAKGFDPTVVSDEQRASLRAMFKRNHPHV